MLSTFGYLLHVRHCTNADISFARHVLASHVAAKNTSTDAAARGTYTNVSVDSKRI